MNAEWTMQVNIWEWRTYRILKDRNNYHAICDGKTFGTFRSLSDAQAAAEQKELVSEALREVDEARERRRKFAAEKMKPGNGGQWQIR